MSDNFFSHCAERLKLERVRLGLGQAGAGKICGVSREMWGKYERSQAVPGSDVLFSFAAAGADVQFIFTGNRGIAEQSPGYVVLRPDQKALIDNVEHCPPKVQKAIKDLAFVSASGGSSETEPQDKLGDNR